MQVPWIDISKELCQLERENRLIAGYSHTRNSSEVFLVHNGHTIYSPNCFKTMPGMTWFNILRCFLEKISEKNHAQHTEKNDDTSHFKSLGTSRSFFSNNIFNCFAFKLYDTGIVSSSAIALLHFFSFKNGQLWVMFKEILLFSVFTFLSFTRCHLCATNYSNTSFLDFNHF